MMDDDSLGKLKYLNGDARAHATDLLSTAFRSHGIHFTKFDRYYVTTPLCCPSRASFLTGQYAHNTGVIHNTPETPGGTDGGADGFTQLGLDQSTIATWFQDAGYRTGLIGRYLNEYAGVTSQPAGFIPPGWDEWHAFYEFGSARYHNFHLSDNGTIVYYPWNRTTDANYETDVYRHKSLAFVATTPVDQPFFLYVAPSAPHGGSIPALRHQNSRRTLVAPRPPQNPAYLEPDVSDKPSWIQLRSIPPPENIVASQDQLYRDGANCMSSVSEAIVSVIDGLATLGRLDNTLFVFTDDNGWAFLDHRTIRKGVPYEVAQRVYLVMGSSNPNLIPANGSRDQLVSNIDLAPTLAEIGGVTIPPGQPLDGVSFASSLSNPTATGRDDLLIEFWHYDSAPPNPLRQPNYSGIVTGPSNPNPDWKYVEYDGGEKELYDLVSDPLELNSLAADPNQAPLIAALAQRLAELRNQ